MPFIVPQRDIVDLAGDALIGRDEALEALNQMGLDKYDVIYSWKNAHQYPESIFKNTLKNRTRQVDTSGIVAQRTKRLSSIEDKLKRYDWLKLSEMQDIAGCRAIVSSVSQVYDLVRLYKRKYGDHELVDEKDYIRNPKSDGYRSYHLIYRYSNDKRPEYKNLKIEMQFRSVLQHYWATAVETADIFYREGLKFHRGSPDWRRFFALMGSAIALREECRRIPRTPKNTKELIDELRVYALRLDVKGRLTAFSKTLNVIGEAATRRAGIRYILLELNASEGVEELKLFGFSAGEIEAASKQTETSERFSTRGRDTVLVSVSDATTLRAAYPSYYLDTTLFLQTLDELIS